LFVHEVSQFIFILRKDGSKKEIGLGLRVYAEGKSTPGPEQDHIPNLQEDGNEINALKPSIPPGVNRDAQLHELHIGNMWDQIGSGAAERETQDGDRHTKRKQQNG
jgi:hypothetical protein